MSYHLATPPQADRQSNNRQTEEQQTDALSLSYSAPTQTDKQSIDRQKNNRLVITDLIGTPPPCRQTKKQQTDNIPIYSALMQTDKQTNKRQIISLSQHSDFNNNNNKARQNQPPFAAAKTQTTEWSQHVQDQVTPEKTATTRQEPSLHEKQNHKFCVFWLLGLQIRW